VYGPALNRAAVLIGSPNPGFETLWRYFPIKYEPEEVAMSRMIAQPERYFLDLVPQRSALLKRLEAEAVQESIPIVGPVVGELLYLLARLSRARRILELGTATGYSAIHLAEAARETGGRLLTLETDAAMAERAAANLAQAGLQDWVEIRCGEALKEMATVADPFDLVFLDIEKADYLPALGHCRRILNPGGLLIADNIAFQEADPFNQALAADNAWRRVSLYSLLPGHSPLYDGLCLALRKPTAS